LQPAHLIGREYFNTDHLGANTGWLGSAYMQAGLAGLVGYGAAVGLIFRYIDACARASGERALITAAVAVPVFALVTSSDLPTALLTHGLYLNLFLIACFHATETDHDIDAHRSSQQRSLA
jgi:O-antigen ligase